MRLPWKRKPLTELEQLTEFYGPEILGLEFETLEQLETEANQLAKDTKYAICGELWGKLAHDWQHIRFLRFPDRTRSAPCQVDSESDSYPLRAARQLFLKKYGYWPDRGELEAARVDLNRVAAYNVNTKMYRPVDPRDAWDEE